MSSDNDEVSVENVPGSLAVIARPLADQKLQKRVLKLIKKSAKDKTLKRGVKEVVKAIRKSHKGYFQICPLPKSLTNLLGWSLWQVIFHR